MKTFFLVVIVALLKTTYAQDPAACQEWLIFMSECGVCNPGYGPNGYTCRLCSSMDENCAECGKEHCHECQDGYYVKDEFSWECRSCRTNDNPQCRKCFGPDACTECDQGYTPSGKDCIARKRFMKLKRVFTKQKVLIGKSKNI